MSALSKTSTPNPLTSRKLVDSHELNMAEVVPHLVGHTIEEVERELIIHTLVYHCGSRTQSANVLGVSLRCLRNKIHEYQAFGISVPAPGESGVSVQH